MKVAFYKAFQKKATLLDWVIAICTLGKYSHTELVFPNGDCFSISPRDKRARFKKNTLNEEQWDIIETPWVDEEEAIRIAKMLLDKKYDYLGALTSATPIHINIGDRQFCSEAVAECLGFEFPSQYSPNSLYKKLTENVLSFLKGQQWDI